MWDARVGAAVQAVIQPTDDSQEWDGALVTTAAVLTAVAAAIAQQQAVADGVLLDSVLALSRDGSCGNGRCELGELVRLCPAQHALSMKGYDQKARNSSCPICSQHMRVHLRPVQLVLSSLTCQHLLGNCCLQRLPACHLSLQVRDCTNICSCVPPSKFLQTACGCI